VESILLNPGLYGSILVLLGLAIGAVGITIYRRQNQQTITDFAALLITAAIYGVGYGFEVWSPSLAGKLFWLKVQYIGISFLPAFWNLMVIQYIGKEKWLTRNMRIALFIIPIVTLVLHYTDAYHQLHYGVQGLITNGPFINVAFAKGPWYWVYVAYLDLSLLFGNLLLFQYWFQAAALYRGQVAIMIIGSLFPWLGHITYIAGNSPWGLDVAPFAFFISLMLFGWGLYGYRLFTLVPIAREVVFDTISDGILVLDLQSRIVDYNADAGRLFDGLSPSSLGMLVTEVLQPYPALWKQITTGVPEQLECNIVRNENYFWYMSKLMIIPNRAGSAIGRILVLHDITRQKKMMETLTAMATTDGLTGIYNRTYFMELSLREIGRAAEKKEPVSLILIDLDYFKQVNDCYGHKAGDIVLQEFVKIIKGELRELDFLGRFGGEEFMVFLANTSAATAMQVAERLRASVAEARIAYEQTEIQITASFGVVALQGLAAGDFDGLFKKADQALYGAKNAGRNSVILAE